MHGYDEAGYELARHAADLCPDDLSDAVWEVKVGELETLCHRRQADRVADWFRANLPACMELVPRRRHAMMADGAIRCYEDGKMG